MRIGIIISSNLKKDQHVKYRLLGAKLSLEGAYRFGHELLDGGRR